jgi:4-amino-4-deoxy-L-arabinose transferase-like glycosyltransferase
MKQENSNAGKRSVAMGKRGYVALAVVLLWAVMYLPNLRTNPNWYGDEGEWMEKCWTFIHGTPRVGPVENDFVFPYPYPPLYMLVNGALLRVFGNDIVVGRALGAVTALAAAGLLFWVGRRLKDERFGVLCAVAWLVYPEAVMNFRWVRSHPMAGTLALACAGFLVAYLQEKRLKHLAWAGAMCLLATATHYYAVGMIPAVGVAALWVNRDRLRQVAGWRDVVVGCALAGGYGVLFVVWHVLTQGGWGHLMEQVARMKGFTPTPPVWEVLWRFVRFCFWTPIFDGSWKQVFVDVWLVLAAVGLVAFPVGRWRVWLLLWVGLLMYPIFQKQENVSFFFYPATNFLPLMALGVAGALEQAGRWMSKLVAGTKEGKGDARHVPAILVLGVLGLISMNGSLTHFRTKIDMYTQRPESVRVVEKAMRIINENTTSEDLVIVPKQVYWLVRDARKTMLSHCVTYAGGTNDAWPVAIPREMFWCDGDWRKAKYLLLAYGGDGAGNAYGIDARYTFGLAGVREIITEVQAKGWPVVLREGEYILLVNPQRLNAEMTPRIQQGGN